MRKREGNKYRDVSRFDPPTHSKQYRQKIREYNKKRIKMKKNIYETAMQTLKKSSLLQ